MTWKDFLKRKPKEEPKTPSIADRKKQQPPNIPKAPVAPEQKDPNDLFAGTSFPPWKKDDAPPVVEEAGLETKVESPEEEYVVQVKTSAPNFSYSEPLETYSITSDFRKTQTRLIKEALQIIIDTQSAGGSLQYCVNYKKGIPAEHSSFSELKVEYEDALGRNTISRGSYMEYSDEDKVLQRHYMNMMTVKELAKMDEVIGEGVGDKIKSEFEKLANKSTVEPGKGEPALHISYDSVIIKAGKKAGKKNASPDKVKLG